MPHTQDILGSIEKLRKKKSNFICYKILKLFHSYVKFQTSFNELYISQTIFNAIEYPLLSYKFCFFLYIM